MKKLFLTMSAMCLCFEFINAQNINQCNIHIAKENRDTITNTESYLLIKGEFIENDTLFLAQEFFKEDLENNGSSKTFLNTCVYLEPNKDSKYYTRNYWISFFDENHYKDDFEVWSRWRMEKKLPSLQKVDRLGLPTDWVPLHFYKGVPCVYAPCVVDVPFQCRMNDSIIVYRNMEPDFASLSKSEKLSDKTYHLTLGNWSYSTDSVEVYIHILDEKTRTAVWEYRYPDKTTYSLLTPVESIPQFDLIVCRALYQEYSANERELFDKVDAKSLLEEVKSGKRTTLFNN